MSRWIDGDWLLNFFESYPDDYHTPLGTLRACVDDAPSLDCDTCEQRGRCDRGRAVDCPMHEPHEPKGEWIPCSERLPEENGKLYLTYQCDDDSRYGWCQVLRYDDGWNCLNGDRSNEIKSVVAWMPLPKPWRGADDE